MSALEALRPIATAPKDRPILAWCDHDEDAFIDPTDPDRLTLYAAHGEGLSYARTGFHIVEWGGGFADTGEYGEMLAELPDWWFVVGSEFEIAANPTHWTPLPDPPRQVVP